MKTDKEIRKLLKPALRLRIWAVVVAFAAIVGAFFGYAKIVSTIGDLWPANPEVKPQDVYRGGTTSAAFPDYEQ